MTVKIANIDQKCTVFDSVILCKLFLSITTNKIELLKQERMNTSVITSVCYSKSDLQLLINIEISATPEGVTVSLYTGRTMILT